MFLTPGGRIRDRGGRGVHTDFKRGTALPFYNSAAPLGWTKLAVNDRALRVVSGSGAATGGSVAFSTMFSGSNPTGSYTLTTTDMPAHTHPQQTSTMINSAGLSTFVEVGGIALSLGGTTQVSGSGRSHAHTIPALQYANVIIAAKD